jgi:putative nucleotidyltransferase with HDIG domain
LTRETALCLIHEHVHNEHLIAHMLAAEAVMRAIAHDKGEDEETWGLAGLLHDLDAEETDPVTHGMMGADYLRTAGWPEPIVKAVAAHNGENNGTPATTLMEKAIRPADQVTGLITASALIRPDRLQGLMAESVLKRFKEKRFAAGVTREIILECEGVGYNLPDFVSLALEAMRGIRQELGL